MERRGGPLPASQSTPAGRGPGGPGKEADQGAAGEAEENPESVASEKTVYQGRRGLDVESTSSASYTERAEHEPLDLATGRSVFILMRAVLRVTVAKA